MRERKKWLVLRGKGDGSGDQMVDSIWESEMEAREAYLEAAAKSGAYWYMLERDCSPVAERLEVEWRDDG